MSAVIGACWSGIVSVPHVGPLETTVERLGTCYYTVKQKREILGNAGLQHVRDGFDFARVVSTEQSSLWWRQAKV